MINWFITATGLQAYGTAIRMAVYVILTLGLFGGGFISGCHWQSTRAERATVKATVSQVKAAPKLDAKVNEKVKEAKVVHDKVYIEVEKLVPVKPECDLGPDVISLLNRNRALSSLPRNDETGAAASTNRR